MLYLQYEEIKIYFKTILISKKVFRMGIQKKTLSKIVQAKSRRTKL